MEYKFIKLLGKGSYGSVYLAKNENNPKIDEYVAIKKFFIKDKVSYKSFKNELKILKKIDNKYLVKIFDYFQDSEYMYIVMEYAPEGDLEEYIRRKYSKGKLVSNKFIDTVLYQINEGLSVLHKKNIIHRDIKTSNILVFNENLVKITDFGVSKILENNKLAYSKIGTPYYMSPEMINGKPYNYMIDYWALGCVVYKMLTNKYPFEANNILGLMYKIELGNYDLTKIPYKYKKLIGQLINKINNRGDNKVIDNFIISNCNTIVKFYNIENQIKPINLKSIKYEIDNLKIKDSLKLLKNKKKLKKEIDPINKNNRRKDYKIYGNKRLEPLEYKIIDKVKNNLKNFNNLGHIIKPVENNRLKPVENNRLKPVENNRLKPVENYILKLEENNRLKYNIFDNKDKKKQKLILDPIKYNINIKKKKEKNFIQFNIKNIKNIKYKNDKKLFNKRKKELEEEIFNLKNLSNFNI